MRMRKSVLRRLLPPVLLALALCGCRTRVTGVMPDGSALPAGSEEPASAPKAESPTARPDADNEGEPGGETRENPDAGLKEFDENAAVEIVAGTERTLHGAGEGSGAHAQADEAAFSTARLAETAEQTATRIVAAGEAERMGVSEDAQEADSAQTYFAVLLKDRLDAVYECQRLTAYWETAEDHVTVFKTSPEHRLILDAGVYDVSARLLAENLLVDDGWIARKNPGVVVKVVDSLVLGGGVMSDAAAKRVYDALLARPGWEALDAVKNGRVLLLSGELLDAPHLRTAACLIIAKTAMPALFGDVDPDAALSMLVEEATGALPGGIYYYNGQGGTP